MRTKNTARIVVMVAPSLRRRLEAMAAKFYEEAPISFADVVRSAILLGADQIDATEWPRARDYVAPPKSAWGKRPAPKARKPRDMTEADGLRAYRKVRRKNAGTFAALAEFDSTGKLPAPKSRKR
jgi:hypothetical protein